MPAALDNQDLLHARSDIPNEQILNNLFWITDNAAAGRMGTDFIQADPSFSDEYHLSPGSPAVNAGVVLPVVTADIDRDLRDQYPDIGADEL